MSLRNTSSQYSGISKFLHWLIFILVLVQILLGFFWDDTGSFNFTAISWHKSLGLTILCLVVLRLAWVLTNPKPTLLNTPAWQRLAAKTIHGLLYLSLIGMPLSGWIGLTAGGKPPQPFGIPLPFPGIQANKVLANISFEVHKFLGFILVGLIALHILAALKHHFIDKDDVLIRMLPKKMLRNTHE